MSSPSGGPVCRQFLERRGLRQTVDNPGAEVFVYATMDAASPDDPRVINPFDSPGEAFLQALYDGISEAVLALSLPKWEIVYWNKGAEAHFGREAEEIKGRSVASVYPDEDAFARMKALCEPVLEKQGSWYGEAELRRHDESIFPAEVAFNTFLRDSDGKSAYVVMVARDVAERKQSEAELERRNTYLLLHDRLATAASEARDWSDALGLTLQHLCEYTNWPIGHVWLCNKPSQKLECTNLWYFRDDAANYEPLKELSEKLPVLEQSGLVGCALTEHKPQWIEDISASSHSMRRQSVARAAGLEAAFALPVLLHGETVAVLEFFGSQVSPRDDALLEVLETLGVSLGRIFERKVAIQQLHQKERMAAVGMVAAKIAHEIGNPLNGMYTTTQLLERHMAEHQGRPIDETVLEAVHTLAGETDRLRTLLEQLRTLHFVDSADHLEPCDLAKVIRDLLDTQSEILRQAKITPQYEFPDGLLLVRLDRARFTQALLNLLNNAIEAMPDGGVLTLRGEAKNDRLLLEVTDTGCGIPVDLQIFDLFTTSKTSGSGLGLPIVEQIVSAHGGWIDYSSDPGKGTTFRLNLPLIEL